MSKVKIQVHTVEQKEVDLEYPIYLYFQDENDFDELIKIDEKYQLRITWDIFGVEIKKTQNFKIEEHYLNNLTNKEHFDMFYNDALEFINK